MFGTVKNIPQAFIRQLKRPLTRSIGDIEDIVLGKELALRNIDVGTLLAFVGVAILKRKYEAIVIFS